MDFFYHKLTFTLVFLLLFIIYWFFNFVILYHLLRFGVGTQPKKIAAVFLLSSIILSFVSTSLLASVNTTELKSKLEMIGGQLINIRNPQ